MRHLVCSLLALAACNPGSDLDDYYVEPGGGNGAGGTGGGGGLVDAAPADGGATINGQICGIVRFTNWSDCTANGFDGYVVKLGASQGVANNAGEFSLPTPAGSGLTWQVDPDPNNPAADAMVTYMPYALAETLVPSVSRTMYTSLHSSIVGGLPQGGGVFIAVRKLNAGAYETIPGATATSSNTSSVVRYDNGSNGMVWTDTATGDSSIVWIPDVVPGPTNATTISVSYGSPVVSKAVTVPVYEDTITLATIVFM